MEIEFIIAAVFGFMFSAMFFVADYYEHKHPRLHVSLIAGISVAYFFLLVLPEISEGLPEYPLHLEVFEYLFVLIGFTFIHVSEKLILQRVEGKSQKRMRKLLNMDKTLQLVEKNIEIIVNEELNKENLDKWTLKHLAETLTSLHEQNSEVREEMDEYKQKIHDHINKDLDELHIFTDYSYHFLVGLILINLLLVEFISGILFFVFALFRTIISNRSQDVQVFSDLDITVSYENSKKINIFLASAAATGTFIGLILDLIFPIDLEVIFILFSFISGVILYTIVREILPEKEKGNPLFFLLGIIGFSIFVFLLNLVNLLVIE